MEEGRPFGPKRAKIQEESIDDNDIFHMYPSLVRTLVGCHFVQNDWKSYFALARVTKALWYDYCHYDDSVRFMRLTYSKPWSIRSSLILHSGLSLCIQWLWDKERQKEPRFALAIKFAAAATEFPLLNIIYMVAPFVPESERTARFTEWVEKLAEFGHDDALMQLVNQKPPWPVEFSKRTRICLYFSAIKQVIQLPKFYALMQTIILPEDLYPNDVVQKTATILSVASTSRIDTLVGNFGFFWNQLPFDNAIRREYLTILISNLFFQYVGSPVTDALPLLITYFFKPFANPSSSSNQDYDTNSMVFSLGRYIFVFEKKPTSLEDEIRCEMHYISVQETRVVHTVLPKSLFH